MPAAHSFIHSFHAFLQRMGGFKRVAAALELEYLHPRRGRGSSQPWSLDSAAPELALVQFSQGSAQSASAHDGNSSNGSGNGSTGVGHVAMAPRVQLQQLSGLPGLTAVSGNGTSRARRRRGRTDHDREDRSTGKGFPRPVWL